MINLILSVHDLYINSLTINLNMNILITNIIICYYVINYILSKLLQ